MGSILIETLKARKGEILNDPYSLDWRPGILEWVKGSRPEDWKRMVALEAMINGKVLTGDIEGLKTGLNDYRDLLLAVIKAFSSMMKQTSLFETLKKGKNIDGETEHSQL